MEIYGRINQIIYQSSKDGFTVAECIQNKNSFSVVGYMSDIVKGFDYTLYGTWENDPVYGRQFCVNYYEENIPSKPNVLSQFLSNIIPELSPVITQIISMYGKDVFTILEDHPDYLRNYGYEDRQIRKIQTTWMEYKGIKEIRLFLHENNISTSYAVRLYDTYRNNAIYIVQNFPYRLPDDLYGMTFQSADSIAKKMGFKQTDMIRLESGILYLLKKKSSFGHCFSMIEELVQSGAKLLHVDSRIICNTLNYMVNDGKLAEETGRIYLPDLYIAEYNVAKRLNDIRSTKIPHVHGYIMAGYGSEQKSAIESAMHNKIMILTGGPGTGKTTTISGIIHAFIGKKIILAAPTGRAAKRMEETTGMPAQTIHRLLEATENGKFGKDENNPIAGNLLIVDECSMIDLKLMESLLRAVPNRMRIVFVGDADQLPSIGPGNVFSDMIRSESFPVARLTTIYRQNQDLIKQNASRIKNNKPLIFSQEDSFVFFDIDHYADTLLQKSPGTIIDKGALCCHAVFQLVNKYLSKQFIPSDIQIISPMKKGNAGTYALNNLFQKVNNTSFSYRDRTFYLQDKVMQVRNNYDKEVYNGDIGYICCINQSYETIYVNFDEHIVEYKKNEIDQLQLAYAITIHKSQGGEYPAIVLVLMPEQSVMLERNLLYTAITRAKEKVVIVGTKDAIAKSIKTVKALNRNTTLTDKIQMYDFPVQKKII